MERCVIEAVSSMHRGPIVQEVASSLKMALTGSQVERGAAIVVWEIEVSSLEERERERERINSSFKAACQESKSRIT